MQKKNNRVFSIKEIYELPPNGVSHELYQLQGHVPEVDVCGLPEQTRVELRHYAYVDFDGVRTWELFSVWLDDKPVMLCQNAGRSGEDHQARFVTSSTLYRQMVAYIQSLVEPEETSCNSLVDENYSGRELTEFYGHVLSEMYDPDFVPQLKPGDTLMVAVNETNPRGYMLSGDKTIMVKVKVLDVNVHCPYSPYRVKETSRVMKYGFGLQPQKPDEPMIVEKKRFKDWKKRGYSEIYLRLSRDLKVRV